MLDKLLLLARNMGASDLHLTPVSVPIVRVDGSLQPLQNEFISGKSWRKRCLPCCRSRKNSSCCRQVRLILLLVTVCRSAAGSIFTALATAMRRRFVCSRRIFLTATALACRKLSVSLPEQSWSAARYRCHRQRQKHHACLAGTADKSNACCTRPDAGEPDRICLSCGAGAD